MPFLLLVPGGAGGGLRGVGLIKPVLRRVLREPVVTLFTVSRREVGVFETVQVDVRTPMVAGRTGHGTVQQDIFRAFDKVRYFLREILPRDRLAAVPLLLPYRLLVVERTERGDDEEIDAFFFRGVVHPDKRGVGLLAEENSRLGGIFLVDRYESGVRLRVDLPEQFVLRI